MLLSIHRRALQCQVGATVDVGLTSVPAGLSHAGCGKPEFFIKKKPLFEVHTETGMLYNTDGGTPMVPIGECQLCRHCMPILTDAALLVWHPMQSYCAHGLWHPRASVPRQANHFQHTCPVSPNTLVR